MQPAPEGYAQRRALLQTKPVIETRRPLAANPEFIEIQNILHHFNRSKQVA